MANQRLSLWAVAALMIALLHLATSTEDEDLDRRGNGNFFLKIFISDE